MNHEELRLKLKQKVNEHCQRNNVHDELRTLTLHSVDRMCPDTLEQRAEEWGVL